MANIIQKLNSLEPAKKKLASVFAAAGIVLIALCVVLVAALAAGGSAAPAAAALTTETGAADRTREETQEEIMNTASHEEGITADSATSAKTDGTQSRAAATTASSAGKGTTATKAPDGPSYLDYTKYNLDAYMTPIWKGNVVYNESIMFYPNAKTKQLESVPLLYTPDKILSLRSNDLQTEYTEGVDFVVENGRIKMTGKSQLFAYSYDDLYLTIPAAVPIPNNAAPGRYVKYASGQEYQETQFAVTYTHKGKWNGTVPAFEGEKLSKTIQKLKNKQPLRIVVYGSSTMTGCDASGQGGYEPNMPIFSNMVVDQLKKSYGYTGITEINTALGGTETKWGLENIRSLVTDKNPDLVIIGFGLNDVGIGTSLAEYEQRTRDMIADVRSQKPDAEFILISTALPNPESGWTGLTPEYKKGLDNIVKNTAGVAVAPMTDMHTELLKHKRYYDMTGNGVNHPNDFLARVYAQTIAQCLIPSLG